MITSENNAKIKELIKLQKNARHRRKEGMFVAEGIKLVQEAAQYGKLRQVLIRESLWHERWKDAPAASPMQMTPIAPNGQNHSRNAWSSSLRTRMMTSVAGNQLRMERQIDSQRYCMVVYACQKTDSETDQQRLSYPNLH